ncbi:DNA methyltransferase [Oleiphilus sp. HI0133]|nr:DNA methyltransferase [Oleiphilus sp. HI0133]
MKIAQIEENVKTLLSNLNNSNVQQAEFIYELLLAYGHRKQSVSRLKSGERNLASRSNEPKHDEVIWKRHVYFKHVEGNVLHSVIDQMRNEKLVVTNKIRFVIVTNYDQLLAVDTKTSDSLDINFIELAKQFDFFLPWAGMEKAVYQGENPADVKAAEKMAKLFDLIKSDNFDESNKNDTEALHNLNVFLTRLLFCFFAEDTEIFSDNQFSHAIKSHTKDDGSDLSGYLDRLFQVLNTADTERGALPDYLSSFPYVNGGLFADDVSSPIFSAKSRRMLIECGSELDWSDINPDIFGSMIQAVVHPDQRGGMGMHYTSVTNIMKVIEPLFLNDLYEELGKIENSPAKLLKFQQRLSEIKIFDPACGSGNFLIIAYKELRKLEMEVLKRLQELELEKTGQISQPFSVIKLSQFYGIELDDFAHEVAILSLWLAEHQMNVEFKTEFGEMLPSLPLKKSGNIICANATRVSWADLCANENGQEAYILGNPPYRGSSIQSKEQKDDIELVFSDFNGFRKLDYIWCWFYKAAKYLQGGKFAFVSTNSICQGEQVSIIWPEIFRSGFIIEFAHQSFKWTNNAKKKAGVTCVIVGLSRNRNSERKIYMDSMVVDASNINEYLIDAPSIFVKPRKIPLSPRPQISRGNIPNDGQNLLLSEGEKNDLIKRYPEIKTSIKKFYGPQEFIKGYKRWILYFEDSDLELVNSIPEIKARVDSVRHVRLNSTKQSTRDELSKIPHRFELVSYCSAPSIFIPRTSSENRDYIPMGFLGANDVIGDAQAIYNPDPYIFGVLNSRMHMVWIRAIAGRFKTDYRYSSNLVYNTFPIPELSSGKIDEIQEAVFSLLACRESFSNQTMADLYNPKKMPDELRRCHKLLDDIIDSLYSNKKFLNDEARLAVLFKMYEKMTGGQHA